MDERKGRTFATVGPGVALDGLPQKSLQSFNRAGLQDIYGFIRFVYAESWF
jgi:hypothetical protein